MLISDGGRVMRSKTVIKNAGATVAFIAGLLALLLLASLVFQPKNNEKAAGIRDVAANGILSEPENTIDVVVIGDSETYSSIIPLQIWEQHGITLYNCGTSGQMLCYSEEFLEKTFKTQSPKVVIFETSAIFRKFAYSKNFLHTVEGYLPVFRYHDRWKTLKKSDFSFEVEYTYIDPDKNYVYSDAVKPANAADYMKVTDAREPIPSKNCGYIKAIKKMCDDNGAKLVFLSTPSTKNWGYSRHNSMSDIAEKLGVEYIDMNLMQTEVPINWETDTRDSGDHLNHCGAVKVTDYLGGYLEGLGLFTDKRDDADYSEWNVLLEKYKAKFCELSSK